MFEYNFSPGDRVRVTDDSKGITVGMVGTITEESYSPFVDFDGYRWAMSEDKLELVSKSNSDSNMSDFTSFAFPIDGSEETIELLIELVESLGVDVTPPRHFDGPGINMVFDELGHAIFQYGEKEEFLVNAEIVLDERPSISDLKLMVNGEYEFDSTPTFDFTLNGYDVEYIPSEDILKVGCKILDASKVLDVAEKLKEIREYHDNA